MLTASLALIGPAAAGLGGLPLGTVAAPALGLAGLALLAAFVALLGGLCGTGAGEQPAHGAAKGAARGAAEAPAFQPRQCLVCALAFTVMGSLAGGLAWEVWESQGPGRALGLVAAALGCGSLALGFGRRALQRRG